MAPPFEWAGEVGEGRWWQRRRGQETAASPWLRAHSSSKQAHSSTVSRLQQPVPTPCAPSLTPVLLALAMTTLTASVRPTLSSSLSGRRALTASIRWACTRTCCAASTPTVSSPHARAAGAGRHWPPIRGGGGAVGAKGRAQIAMAAAPTPTQQQVLCSSTAAVQCCSTQQPVDPDGSPPFFRTWPRALTYPSPPHHHHDATSFERRQVSRSPRPSSRRASCRSPRTWT